MMKKNLRLLIGMLFASTILLVFSGVSASAYVGSIYDLADKLTTTEEANLTMQAQEAASEIGINVCVVVINDLEGKSAMAYADDFYDKTFNINTDGILLLINLDTGYDWISTSGKAIDYYTDSRIDKMFDKMELAMKNYDVNREAEIFLSQCTSKYIEATSYDLSALISGGFFALIITGIWVLITVSKYKLHAKTSATNYACNDSTQFTVRTDRFLREYTTKTRIQSNSGGGRGGSSTHRSSSGGRHGGGGRGR